MQLASCRYGTFLIRIGTMPASCAYSIKCANRYASMMKPQCSTERLKSYRRKGDGIWQFHFSESWPEARHGFGVVIVLLAKFVAEFVSSAMIVGQWETQNTTTNANATVSFSNAKPAPR